jgi:OFA family oxalate/formate antiporter-like MFS transporter
MSNISIIHGLCLSAWAIAGLTGNQLSAYIISKTHNYNNVLYILLILYIIAMIISFVLVKPSTDNK